MKVVFKNLTKSEWVRQALLEKLQDDVERFPDLPIRGIRMSVAMENSPQQAGPDVFKITLQVLQGRYRGVSLEKTGSNFYEALSKLDKSLVERLSRYRSKRRSLHRRQKRNTENNKERTWNDSSKG